MSKNRLLLLVLALAGIAVVAFFVIPFQRFFPPSPTAPGPSARPETRPETPAATTAVKTAASAQDEKPKALIESLATTLSPAPPAPGGDAPSFDVVTVGGAGDAVVAGRAAPGATVELIGDGKTIDRAVADRSGNFVMTPSQLPAGNYALSLRMTKPGGGEALSQQSVPVKVEPGRAQQTVVASRPPERPPARETVAVARSVAVKSAGTAVALDKIEAAPGGKLSIEGRASPGATVRLYLNDSLLAASKASGDGRLRFAVEGGVRPGDYRVRLEEVDGAAVRARAESLFTVTRTMVAEAPPAAAIAAAPAVQAPPAAQASPAAQAALAAQASPNVPSSPSLAPASQASAPLASAQPMLPSSVQASPSASAAPAAQAPGAPAKPEGAARASADAREPPVVVVPAIKTTVVHRGDSLWRISQETYGLGQNYPVIFHANQQQIRNPHLIYPGQIFVLPDQGRGNGQKPR